MKHRPKSDDRIVFGLGAIGWGLVTNKMGRKRLAAIGAGGIAFTVVIYSSLFYFGSVQRSGVYDDLRQKLAQNTINTLVPSIEFFNLQNGRFPASLEELGFRFRRPASCQSSTRPR